MLWSLLWQDQAVLREISRPHGARLLTSFESRQYMPVIKATSTRTSKNNIQWWKILPTSDKEITPLKSSWSLDCNLRKRIVLQRRIVLVLLTAIDLRQTTCVTRQYFFTIHFFASQRLPEGPACLYNYIYLLLSSFFFSNTSCSKISVTFNQDDLQPSITWQKKEPALFWSANFPRLPRQFT